MQKVLGLATLPKSTATMKNKLHKWLSSTYLFTMNYNETQAFQSSKSSPQNTPTDYRQRCKQV